MATRKRRTSVVHATVRKAKETPAEKAAKKIASYIHGHRRHGSHLASGATIDAWKHIGQAKRQG